MKTIEKCPNPLVLMLFTVFSGRIKSKNNFQFFNIGETDIDECEVEKIDCGGRGFCINTLGSYR